jgi:hypothetical protein
MSRTLRRASWMEYLDTPVHTRNLAKNKTPGSP